jgi:ribonucleoside-diphosphate reductase alpha chain
VHGYTRQIQAPEGKLNVTINSDDEGPLEVFINVGKAGSDIAALAEALGRLISLVLRIPSPITPLEKAEEIVDQLRNIGGSRSVGFGPAQVRSLPDAVSRVLEAHLADVQSPQQPLPGLGVTSTIELAPMQAIRSEAISGPRNHNLCPDCGRATLAYQEGCVKCLNCGYSEC